MNVLLQELERFDGVCMLATYRKITLDKALERRVSLKVEFERPDREMRREIWRKLRPAKMPLAGDVDLDRLSEEDLTQAQRSRMSCSTPPGWPSFETRRDRSQGETSSRPCRWKAKADGVGSAAARSVSGKARPPREGGST